MITRPPSGGAGALGPAHLRTRLADDPRARAHRVLPGGYGRATFLVGTGSPYAVRGEGCRVWDDTGRVLLDLNNNFTTLIHGHGDPATVAAATEATARGCSFGLPNEHELRHAETLLERLPHADLVRYANSGTEAVMLALRLARAHTGRSRTILIRRAYHGTSDAVLPAGDARSLRGVPPAVADETTVLPLNDVAALEQAIEREGARVAAVAIDLLANRGGLVAAEPAYVEALAGHCRAHGIVLIVDEVISFRLGWAGRAAAYGVAPDLVVLGKLIGGGFPVGAVAGRAELMEELDPARPDGLEHGGTFSGNPVTMAAGVAALERWDRPAIERLNALGETMRATLAGRVAPLGWELRGAGSLLRPWPSAAPAAAHGELQRALWWAAYGRGVLLNPTGLAALSTALDDEAVAQATQALAAAIADVADGWRPAA